MLFVVRCSLFVGVVLCVGICCVRFVVFCVVCCLPFCSCLLVVDLCCCLCLMTVACYLCFVVGGGVVYVVGCCISLFIVISLEMICVVLLVLCCLFCVVCV